MKSGKNIDEFNNNYIVNPYVEDRSNFIMQIIELIYNFTCI